MYAQDRFEYALSTRPVSAPGKHAATAWQDAATKMPETSGIYLTRDSKNQTWFKYFEANFGVWHMSWMETTAGASRQSSRLSMSDMADHLVAWTNKPNR